MDAKLFYRNPSGQLELKDFTERIPSHQRYVHNPEGALVLKEFAADSQLGLLRIADPVSTALVQGYTNATLIGDKIFTPVRMAKESGRFPAFGQEAFVLPGNLKREVGEKVQRLQAQSGYVTQSLSEYALGVAIENRERNEWAGAPEMLLTSKLTQVTDRIALYREYLQAKLATTYTNYASALRGSGAAFKWGGATPTGDPVSDMRKLILTVQSYVGRRPNVAWFTPASWELFIQNSAVLNRIKYGGSPITPAQMSTRAAAELLARRVRCRTVCPRHPGMHRCCHPGMHRFPACTTISESRYLEPTPARDPSKPRRPPSVPPTNAARSFAGRSPS